MTKKIQTLKAAYEVIVNEYMEIFCKKQDVDFDGWVGEDVGSVACIADMFLNFSDIKTDVDMEVKSGEIINWYWDNMPQSLGEEPKSINYYSYLKGLRVKDIK